MPGPRGLTPIEWGRIWAIAFIVDSFKDTLEKSPKDAAEQVFGTVNPLFSMHEIPYIQRFFDTLRIKFPGVECLKIRDNRFIEVADQPELDRLRNMLQGNRFFLWKNGVPLCAIDPQNIDTPQTPRLKRNDWVRIYADAFLAPHSPHAEDFRGMLENDPARAVKEFGDKHPPHPHPANGPIFEFPRLDKLKNALDTVLPPGDPLRNEAKLKEILEKIANGMPEEETEGYRAVLEVTLSC